nr:unnamed protein product [Callosobruchus chinensis]
MNNLLLDGGKLVTPSATGKGRKKQRQESKRQKLKVSRYAPKSLPVFPKCGHNGKPGYPYFCANLTRNQIKTFHEKLYAVKDKVVQDTYILKCCHAEKPKKTDKNKARNNTVSISYKIPNEKGTLIRVCKNAFLGITGVE